MVGADSATAGVSNCGEGKVESSSNVGGVQLSSMECGVTTLVFDLSFFNKRVKIDVI